MHRHRSFLLGVLFCALIVFVPSASAREPLRYIVQDDALFLAPNVAETVDKSVAAGFTDMRVTANWAELVPETGSKTVPNIDLSNPASYPQDKWVPLDRAVKAAHARGMKVIIDVGFWAPYWATADAAGSQGTRARTHVNPALYAQFATALSRRYRGDFVDPQSVSQPDPNGGKDGGGGGTTNPGKTCTVLEQIFGCVPTKASATGAVVKAAAVTNLPRVETYTLWNEPNIGGFLQPQWKRGSKGIKVAASAIEYRKLIVAATPAIRAVDPGAKILIGGTAASGSYTIKSLSGGVPPMQFLRELACVDAQYKPLRRDGCKNFKRLDADGWAHHPYTFTQKPTAISTAPDDVRMGDLDKLHDGLNRLVKMGRLDPKVRNIWLTEFGYFAGAGSERTVTEERQTLWTAWSYQLAWSHDYVSGFSQFLLQDTKCVYTGNDACLIWPTGWWTPDGVMKQVASAQLRQLVGSRSASGVLVWSRIVKPTGQWRAEALVNGAWRDLGVVAPGTDNIWSTNAPVGTTQIRMTDGTQTVQGQIYSSAPTSALTPKQQAAARVKARKAQAKRKAAALKARNAAKQNKK